MSNAPNTRK
jgi:serine/threonine protein kinase